jgi:hypothetical protein
MHHFRTNPPSRQIAPTPMLMTAARRGHALREKVERYLATSELTDGGFGRRAAGDFSLVRKLRNGDDIDAATAAKVERFIGEALHA